MKRAVKLVVATLALTCISGCIFVSDLAEHMSAVPYGGMYTEGCWTKRIENDGEVYLNCYKRQFPIGFWGDLNVKFWNAYGDYRKTSTYKRFKEWRELPYEKTSVLYARRKLVDGEWVDVPLD